MKALLVGINKYKQSPLNGCVNDVYLINDILKKRGFETKILVDNDATKANILSELDNLFENCEHAVFHYSGHGSQVPDKSNDEKDGLDECLLPVDFSWDNVILDDDIDGFINKHQPKSVEIILDACHSGTGTRNVLLSKPDTQSRFIIPPKELFDHIKDKECVKIKSVKLHNVIAWGGCRDDQTSADALIDGKYNGAFTFALCKFMSGSRRQTLKNVRQYLKNCGYTQCPQLTCDFSKIGCAPFTSSKSLTRALKFWA